MYTYWVGDWKPQQFFYKRVNETKEGHWERPLVGASFCSLEDRI